MEKGLRKVRERKMKIVPLDTWGIKVKRSQKTWQLVNEVRQEKLTILKPPNLHNVDKCFLESF